MSAASHPKAGTLTVRVVANCPYLSTEDGKRVMACLEEEKKKVHGVVKALIHGGSKMRAEDFMLVMNMLKEKFPAVPLDQLAKLAI